MMTQLFWKIVLGKIQCGKTGATDEGFFINLQQKYHVRDTTSRKEDNSL